jgi:hypothetical protein
MPGVVADGYSRWRTATEATIRAEVTQIFAAGFRDASLFRRFKINRQIERQVRRRLREVEPSPEALF